MGGAFLLNIPVLHTSEQGVGTIFAAYRQVARCNNNGLRDGQMRITPRAQISLTFSVTVIPISLAGSSVLLRTTSRQFARCYPSTAGPCK